VRDELDEESTSSSRARRIETFTQVPLCPNAEQALAGGEYHAEQDQREPGQGGCADRLVQQHGAVDHRESGHQERHERQPAAPVESQNPEEKQLPGERRHESECEKAGECRSARRFCRRAGDCERQQRQRPSDHRSGGQHGSGRSVDPKLSVDTAARIRQR
jgi:hypothetical protein